MSFNLTDLKKKVDPNISKSTTTYYQRKIVIGSDFFSILRFLSLHQNFPSEVKMIGDRPLSAKALKRDMHANIRRIRTEEDAKLFSEIFPEIELKKIESSPKFYKDGELKEFGGKAEPMKIFSGEKEFVSTSYQFDLTSLIKTEIWEKLDSILDEFYLEKRILSIENTENNDLAEPRNFKLTTGDEQIYLTEEIFYQDTVKSLLNLFTNKSDLGDDAVHFISSYKSKSAIELSFILNKEIETDQATFLFPRSQTHEWGHYIFEFTQIEQKPALNAVILIHAEEYNEEELAKKIRHFKTTIKRFYSDFETTIEKEHILFHPEYYLINEETLTTKIPSLHLNRPLDKALDGLTYLTKPFHFLK